MEDKKKKQVNVIATQILNDLASLKENKVKKISDDDSLEASTSTLLGDILLITTKITPERLNEALELQKKDPSKNERIGDILIKKKYITEDELYNALSYQLNIPYFKEINIDKLDLELIKKIPINFAKKFKLIPIEKRENLVVVAIDDPTNYAPLDDLRLILNSEIKPVLSRGKTIIDSINKAYDKATATRDVMEGIDDDFGALDVEEAEDLLDTDDDAPVIRLVNSVLTRAVKEGASDIHIEPFEKDLVIRYRVDGALHDVLKPPKKLQHSIASRIKIMAKLNIAEKRLPQDGRIKIKIAGKDVDIRLSTLPIAYGERIVMRLLDRSSIMLSLKDLGFSEKNYQKVLEIIYKPHGIFLVTGPTGSGKTTTLYACLSKIYSVEKNIITVEDPIEYQLQGIGQIQVNPKINLTFAGGLRSILRQDPDIIMVGEIRDGETAEIAVQASLTGHFVFSTLHTNDAFGAIGRLYDMGVEPFLISSTLVGIQAQRLVRNVCPACKKAVTPKSEELAILNLKKEDLVDGIIYKAVGCPTCNNTGYKGRTGIHEILPVDDEIRAMIIKSLDAVALKRHAIARGMKTLRDDGALKVAEGVTTIEEVLKVTQVDSVIE